MKKTKATPRLKEKRAKLSKQRKLLNCMLSIYESMIIGDFDCPLEDLPQHILTMQRQITNKCYEIISSLDISA